MRLRVPIVGVRRRVPVQQLAEVSVEVRALDELPDLPLENRKLGRIELLELTVAGDNVAARGVDLWRRA